MNQHGMFEGYGGPVRVDAPDYSGIDPTLDACCQREAESNLRRGAVETALRRHDRVAQAERRRRHVLAGLSFGSGCRCCYDPDGDGGEYAALTEARERLRAAIDPGEAEEEEADGEDDAAGEDKENKVSSEPAAAAREGKAAQDHDGSNDDGDSDGDDSDSEFDYLLDEDLPGEEGAALKDMEEQRRMELEMAALHRESALQHGFGAHRQMHPGRALRAAGLGTTGRRGAAGAPPAAVLHLYDPESEASASLDLFLESDRMAGTYRGTKFLRTSGRAALLLDADLAECVLPRVRPDADIPALVAVRDGEFIAYCPRLEGLADDAGVDARAVEDWLDHAGVLARDPPKFEGLCRVRPEEDVLHEVMMREQAAAAAARQPPERGELFNCGVEGCNKTFRHEHVGVKNEEQAGLVVSEEEAVGGG